ncbi:LysR family transcriptional regulator [Streptomyces cavernae]|uniref:LysR family transcriptional regulator n=1 Tax=Streptomyces cavernae TaxID=2259034 RepID=UPI001390E4CB|nr:LysR family transcriptional regulator [Streptomyces cavernae]
MQTAMLGHHPVDLVKIRHFVAVAQLASFARAAERLHISQPALSRSIQSLERTYSVRLLDRDRSGVALTSAGRLLLPKALDLLANAESLGLEIEAIARGVVGTLSFGIGGGASGTLVPEVLADLLPTFPQLQVSVTVGSYETLASRLAAAADEFFLSRAANWSPQDASEVEVIGRGSPMLFVRPGHPLLAEESVPLRALADYRLLATTEWNAMVDALPHRRERDLMRARVVLDELSVMVAVTHRSDLVMVSSSVPDTGGLVPLRVRGNFLASPLLKREAGIFTLPNRSLSPAATAAVELLRSRAGLFMQPVSDRIEAPR